jgi:BioD-like phosphotransacetylase family protein
MLPATYRRQQMLRNRSAQWATAIAAVLVAGWGWHWFEMREQAQLTQQLDVLSREHAPTRAMLQQVVDMRRQLKDLDHQERVAKELETQRNALTLLGVVSNNAQKANGRLRVTKMELSNFQSKTRAGDAAVSGPAASGLLLAGVSLDNPSVAELFEGLQKSGIFSKVSLKTLKEREGTVLRDFEVTCEF